MSSIEQQIENTNKQLEKLKAKKKALQAKERNAKRTKKRKDETRKKIITGSMIEYLLKKGHQLIILNKEISQDDALICSLEDLHQLLVSNKRDAEFLNVEFEKKGTGTVVTDEVLHERVNFRNRIKSVFEELNM